MDNSKVKLVIGFITYGKSTAKYLPYFLPSLKRQDLQDFLSHGGTSKIICFDNGEEGDNGNIRYIKDNYSEIEIMREGKNIGFASAYNKMIARAKELSSEYFLVINPDIILEPDAIKIMISAMDNNNSLGSVSPKILKWDFAVKKKTNIVDTYGIKLLPGLRFVDLGQGTKDGNINDAEIVGPSGAAGLYRMSALKKVKEGDNYFDEFMFMYKEDCDLAYRLKLAGYRSKCVNNAIIYHDRSASAKGENDVEVALNRKNKNRQVKKWSFLGQQIIFAKYWRLQDLKNKLAIIWYQVKMLIFIILFEQYLLKGLFNLYNIKKKIKIYK